MTARKKILAALLATLQVAWSFSWGAYEAVAQVVHAPTTGVHAGGAPVIPVSGLGAFTSLGQTFSLPQASLTASFVPALTPVPALALAAALTPQALALTPLALAPAPAIASHVPVPTSPMKTPALTPLHAAAKDGSPAVLRRDVPTEDSSRSGEESFAQLYPEALIETRQKTPSLDVQVPTAKTVRAFPFLSAAAKTEKPRTEPPAAKAPAPARSAWSKPVVRIALGVAAAAAIAVALPLLSAHVAAVAATGSIVLGAIGIPQIVKNFKSGREGVKDLAVAGPLIWFAAAVMLSVASIGHGSSIWWNAVNVLGVAESAIVAGQINWHKRDRKELKATALTALASLAPLPLIAAGIFLPVTTWLTVAFTAAMVLLGVLNWPQIRRNHELFKAEGRAPKGIAPLYPILVVAGSLLHLYAAVMGADMRWALNAVLGILTTAVVLGQIYAPRATNALIGPAVRLISRLLPGAKAPDAAALQAKARALVAPLLPASLSRHAAKDGGAGLKAALEKAKALPGRSVVFLEAPTAAGKSTLAAGLHATLGDRIKVFPVDRYFKPKGEVPIGADGEPDFDRPDSLYLDRVAADIKTLLAGGRVELPLNDMATQTTRFDSGEFLTLGADEVLVVDSIYASHEKLLAAADGRATLNLYLDAPAVVRLARRLRRDRLERGISAETNLKRWPVILRDENEFIHPLKRRADAVLNLIEGAEIAKLADTYAEVLAAEWGAHGEDPALTARFLEAVRSSLAADQAARPLRILITGPPGSGKSTHGKKLAEDYGMIHISVGDLLRARASSDPELAALMAKGELVDSALVRGLVLERLARPDVVANGFILDGFPRRQEEIGVIDSWIAGGGVLDAIVNLDASDEELRGRILARGRADDTPEVFRRRMEIYREQTKPVLEHYRGSVRVLEAEAGGTIESAYEGVRGLIESVLAQP